MASCKTHHRDFLDDDRCDDCEAERVIVTVGNIGEVHNGFERLYAELDYEEYVEQSRSFYGRACGEDVTMLDGNGEEIRYFEGILSQMGVSNG